MVTVFAWGFAAGYVVAKVINMIGAIRSAKRDANRRITEARERLVSVPGVPPPELSDETTPADYE